MDSSNSYAASILGAGAHPAADDVFGHFLAALSRQEVLMSGINHAITSLSVATCPHEVAGRHDVPAHDHRGFWRRLAKPRKTDGALEVPVKPARIHGGAQGVQPVTLVKLP